MPPRTVLAEDQVIDGDGLGGARDHGTVVGGLEIDGARLPLRVLEAASAVGRADLS